MSFNIAGAINTEDDGENAWVHRASLNVATIQRHAPDLIGFQQLDDGNLATYRKRLPEYEYVLGSPADEPDLPDYNAVYWHPQSLELRDAGGFYLSETPERWSRGWDAACVRAVTWARLRLRESGERFLHLNTHLDHIGEIARQEGMRLLLSRLPELREHDLPVIMTGDFNCNPWSPAERVRVETTFTDRVYHLARAAGFADTFLAVGGEDNAAAFTFHGFEGDGYSPVRHHMAGRIDWILTLDGARRVHTRAYTLIRDQAPPVYPSDHWPILAEIEFTN